MYGRQTNVGGGGEGRAVVGRTDSAETRGGHTGRKHGGGRVQHVRGAVGRGFRAVTGAVVLENILQLQRDVHRLLLQLRALLLEEPVFRQQHVGWCEHRHAASDMQ